MQESLNRFKEVAIQAVKDGVRVRGYISCVLGCPYDGPIHPKAIAKVFHVMFLNSCQILVFFIALHHSLFIDYRGTFCNGLL